MSPEFDTISAFVWSVSWGKEQRLHQEWTDAQTIVTDLRILETLEMFAFPYKLPN